MSKVNWNPEAKTKREIVDLTEERIDLGVADKYGRPIGALIIRSHAIHTELEEGDNLYYGVDPGQYWVLKTHATRNGVGYGASHQTRLYTTEVSREAAATKYLADALKRAERASQKREGGAA